MGLMEPPPLQNGEEKQNPVPVYHPLLLQLLCPFGRENRFQAAVITCVLVRGHLNPRSSALVRSTPNQAEEEADNRQSCCTPFNWGQGTCVRLHLHGTFKNGIINATVFSGAVELKISPASSFPTGILSSEHFCPPLLSSSAS